MITINNNANNFNLKLNGIVGTSRTNKTNGLAIKVFSTFANANEQNDLLRQLKPMREIVEASQLSDLSSLLQRDLNDKRVADHLVPYLLGEANNAFAFFPSIIAVLIPNHFLTAEEEQSAYPKLNSDISDSNEECFGDLWKLKYYPQNDGNKSNIGELFINTNKVSLVVIDGQHRANAFRVVTKNFDTNQFVYSEFYSNLQIPDAFNSDLPVTIIWFENQMNSNTSVDPKFISRRLFIDVNNNAKSISHSRSILLDDFDPIAVSTRGFYSYLAQKNGFKGDTISLLQTAFDIDSNLKDKKQNDICITNPEIIYDVFYRIFFNNRTFWQWNQNEIKAQRFFYDRQSATKYLKDKIVQNISINSDIEEDYSRYSTKLIVTDDETIKKIPEKLKEQYEIIEKLFNNFTFYRIHLTGCELTESAMDSGRYSLRFKDVWRKVFAGGEGLFYSLEQIRSNRSTTTEIDLIQKEIIELFISYRNEQFKKSIDEALISKFYSQTLSSKAFQVGFLTAYYHLNEQHMIEDQVFIEKINNFIEDHVDGFIYLMTEFRKQIIGELDPKKWPTIQNLFIRIFCNSHSTIQIHNYKIDSPDRMLFSKSYINAIDALFSSLSLNQVPENFDAIDPTIYYNLIDSIITKCTDSISLSGLNVFDNYREICIQSIESDELYRYIKIHNP